MKLSIPQIAAEFKNRTLSMPDQVYIIDYDKAEELTGWTRKEMEDYKRGGKTFYDDVETVGEIIHVSVYFGYRRILSEIMEEAQ